MKKLNYNDIKNSERIIYEYIRGSYAHGTEKTDGSSDIDTGFVYLEPYEQLLGLGIDYQEQIADEKNDNVGYSIKKFMNLLLKSNPTVLEALFIPERCIIYEHPIITEIKKHRDKFVTKECFKPFGGYAVSQIQKATGYNKKCVNPITKRLEPLDFAYTIYKQGSTKILYWLEHRGLMQKYCGLVNIPNMGDTMGVYYDWGNHFLNENISYHSLQEAYFSTKEDETLEIIHKLKTDNSLTEDMRKLYENRVKKVQLGNMARFICDFYNVSFNGAYSTFKIWYSNQIPIGYKGMVGEDKLSNELRLSSVSKDEKPICFINYNKNGYSQHCREYKEYQEWVQKRNQVRYESNKDKSYDAKNVSECFRLVNMCIEIANGEGVKCDRRDIDREFLLDIKNHKYEYEELMNMLLEKKKIMDEAILNSKLPDKIDVDFVNNLLLNIRKMQLYK